MDWTGVSLDKSDPLFIKNRHYERNDFTDLF